MAESSDDANAAEDDSKIVDLTFAKHPEDVVFDADVQVLDLTANGWRKMERFESLRALRVLCLRNNYVEAIECTEDLASLEELDMYGNRLTTIENIAHLKNLVFVSPGELFRKLNLLDLSFNRIERMDAIKDFPVLRELFLCSNRISVIEGLTGMDSLRLLELGSNKIRTIGNLEGLTQLRSLWLGRNKIAAVSGLDALTGLERLDLQANRLAELTGLAMCVNLRELYLAHNGLSSLTGLTHLTNLSLLDLTKNRLASLAGVENLTQLDELWLSHNALDDWREVERVRAARNLQTIYLEGNGIASHLRYRAIVKDTLPSLTQIDATLCAS